MGRGDVAAEITDFSLEAAVQRNNNTFSRAALVRTAWGIALSLLFCAGSGQVGAAGVKPVDDARLIAAGAETANWLHAGRTYANDQFSPLRQIDRSNVKQLRPAWIHQTGIASTFQTSPIVADGIMYITTPFSNVEALNARTGRPIWRYEHDRGGKKPCCGPANRGVGIGYGMVYVATVDAQLVALDAATGKKIWAISIAETGDVTTEAKSDLSENDSLKGAKVTGSTGVAAVAAPLVYDGLVIIGITGVGYGLHLESDRPGAPLGGVVGVRGRYGRPGFIAAFDAKTGEKNWSFDTTQKGWEGDFVTETAYGVKLNRDIEKEKAEVEANKEAWQYGGGSVWQTPAVDIERGLLYFGIGNPSPQATGDGRPGDNLYTVALVALEARTGKLSWYYQQVPHDLWGYDVASPPSLFELEIGGEKIPAIGQASKLGWYFVHDRRDGRLLFKSEAFVPQENMFALPTAEGTRITPAAAGGSNWSPTAYDPASRYVYVAGMHMPFVYRRQTIPATADKPEISYSVFEPAKEPNWGILSAIDLGNSGRIAWQQRTDQPLVGGVLATAGGLVFTGEGNGDFSAFDAASGEKLWSFYCGAGVNAPPMAFAIDGRQYIAVAAGGSKIWGYRTGDSVLVFALPEEKAQ